MVESYGFRVATCRYPKVLAMLTSAMEKKYE